MKMPSPSSDTVMPVHSSAKSRSRSGSQQLHVSYRGSRHARRHRRSRGGRQVDRRPRRRAGARLHLPGLRGDVPRVALARAARSAADAATSASSGDRVLLDGEDVSEAIRTPEISQEASRRAADPAVRAALVDKQRALIAAGDWVAEGRDIGTVVAPDAELKVFLTADEDERAPAGAACPWTRSRERDAARRAAASTRRWSAGARRRRGRHHRARASTRSSSASSVLVGGEDAREGRGRRLSQRRQVLARQPPDRLARGGRARAPGHHARPQGARLRVERPALHADRHRRHGLPRRRPDRRLDPRAGAGGARRRRGRGARRRRARRAAARRPGDRRPAAPLARAR